jgi:hypothetical protein
LFVAAGGTSHISIIVNMYFTASGHGFKFAPVIGPVIADIFERKSRKYAARFAWRKKSAPHKFDGMRFVDKTLLEPPVLSSNL